MLLVQKEIKMIVVRLKGGLGNQLFQYAAGRALATRLNAPLKFDNITSLSSGKARGLELDKFEVNVELATKAEVKKFIPFPGLYYHKPKAISLLGKNIFHEKHFEFDDDFNLLRDPVYLDGYWQSPKYFESIASTILSEYKIKGNYLTNVKSKAVELQNSDTISVHIRRGDFLNPKANAYHGTLPLEYYKRAINILREKTANSTLCFFSDDIEWVKEQFKELDNIDFISSHTKSAIEDFFLMSSCRHNIIANSSFSWWAAWLNRNPGKIVIAPTNWFAVSSIKTYDLFPPNWLRI